MGNKPKKAAKRPQPPAGSAWGRLTARHGRHGAVLMLALAALLVGSLGYAMQGERPWSRIVQKRLEKKQPLQPKEHAVIGLWWGSLINAGLLTALLVSARRWMPERDARNGEPKPEATPDTPQAQPLPSIRPQVILALTLGAVILGGWMRYPRLAHSLWNDEEYAMRRFAHGAWEDKGNGVGIFTPVTWTDTLYENRNGNNHLLSSLVTRNALTVWRHYADAARDGFSETALRFPAFVFGLLTIAMMALLGREMRAPLSGIAAAWLLAVAPWHVRYAVEAKGYSMMLFFVCLALLSIARAIRKDGLHWWIVFAISEAAFLLSFAGSLYVAVTINIFAAVALFRRDQRARLWTLAAFNVMAALPVIAWMLPSIPQLLAYLKSEDSLHLDLGWPWLRDFLSGCAIGFQYENPLPALHSGTDWLTYSAAHPLGALFLRLIVPIMAIIGAVAAWRRGFVSRLMVLAPALACAIAYAHNVAAHSPMVVWYLIYILLPLSLAVPFAIECWQRKPSLLAWGGTAALVIAFAGATWQPCLILRDHDRQPIRQTVALIRERSPDALTAVFGVSDRQTSSYDPGVKPISSVEGLEKLISKARLTGFDLYVYFCGEQETGKRNPDLMKAVREGLPISGATPASFEHLASLKGTEEMFSYQVYKLRPLPPKA